MNEEYIGYHFCPCNKLKLLINRVNYNFFVTNELTFQPFMCISMVLVNSWQSKYAFAHLK